LRGINRYKKKLRDNFKNLMFYINNIMRILGVKYRFKFEKINKYINELRKQNKK